MTDTDTPDPPPHDTPPPPEGSSTEASEAARLRREAAGYRTKLRDAEAARDALSARVERLQRAEVERIAAGSLAQPADLWLLAQPGDLLSEEGDVDPEKVTAKLEEIVAERPTWAARPAVPSFDGGSRGSPAAAGASWQSVLSGREGTRT